MAGSKKNAGQVHKEVGGSPLFSAFVNTLRNLKAKSVKICVVWL